MIQEDAYKEVEVVDTRFVSEINLLSHASRLLCPFFFLSLLGVIVFVLAVSVRAA